MTVSGESISETAQRDVVADVLADIVAVTRTGSVAYGRTRLSGPWSIAFAPRSIATVHVVTTGACYLTPDGGESILLAQGDVALLPSGIGHVVSDAVGRPPRSFEEVFGGTIEGMSRADLVLEGEGPITGMLCGAYLLERAPRHPFTESLPAVVHITAGQARGSSLAAALDLLAAEVDGDSTGSPAVVASLLDLLFVYVLRSWLVTRAGAAEGWARALRDPAVGTTLALVHGDPGRPWTVQALAQAVGVPQSGFSRRFTTLTGQTPMAYVTAWRMTVAARLLREGPAPLRRIAREVGYDSEFAFARAFKRVVGQPPGHYRAAHRPER
ncbi:AraC family transcriptional regulator [Streptomyces sp. NPDC056304]|uniref:AraC family transcriptional regulator n=1 Tax=Streptomyces sp. NPDC056304 TaxID=3345778 RepID=UPI0035DA27E3